MRWSWEHLLLSPVIDTGALAGSMLKESARPLGLHGDRRQKWILKSHQYFEGREHFKKRLLSQAHHLLTSFSAECCCNHNALARLLLPSYKWFILTSGPFLLKSTSRYKAGDFYWQQRTYILGQRKQLCAMSNQRQHSTCAQPSNTVCIFSLNFHLTPWQHSTQGSRAQSSLFASTTSLGMKGDLAEWEEKQVIWKYERQMQSLHFILTRYAQNVWSVATPQWLDVYIACLLPGYFLISTLVSYEMLECYGEYC